MIILKIRNSKEMNIGKLLLLVVYIWNVVFAFCSSKVIFTSRINT